MVEFRVLKSSDVRPPDRIRQNSHLLRSVSPDQAADDQSLALKTGYDPAFVSRNRDDVRNHYESERMVTGLTSSPGAKRYMSNPENMAVSRHDWENLVETESHFSDSVAGLLKSSSKQALRLFPNLAKFATQLIGVKGGILENFPETAFGIMPGTEALTRKAVEAVTGRTLPENPVYKKVSGFGTEVRKGGIGTANEIQKNILDLEWLNLPEEKRGRLINNWHYLKDPEWLAFNIGEAFQSLAPMAAATVYGGPVAGGFVGGGQEGADLYNELINSGVDGKKALVAAGTFGAITGVLNKIGFRKITEKIPTASIVQRIAHGGVAGMTEALTEYLEEPFQAAIGSLAKGEDRATFWTNFLDSFKNIDVMVGAFVAGGGMNVVGNTIKQRQEVALAENDVAFFQALGNSAANSETLQNLPAAYRKAIQHIKEANGGEIDVVYVEPQLFQTILEEKPELSGQLGIDDQIAVALATNSDIEIPIEDYATYIAGTDLSERLINDIKYRKDGTTANEARAAQKSWANEMEAQLRDIREQKEFFDEFERERRVVYDDIMNRQMAAAGYAIGENGKWQRTDKHYTLSEGQRQSALQMRSNAEVVAAYSATMSARYPELGSPMEVYQKTFSGVQAVPFDESEIEGGVLNQADETDPAHEIANQIKSATDNGGSFDPENPDIYLQINKNKPSPRGAFNTNTNIVSLFEKANASTFLHETAHAFFTFLQGTANLPNAPENLKKDWQVVLNFVGNDGTKELTEDQHEKTARALEAYFLEGKAPSPGLRSVFQQFTDWLKRIYRQVTQLGVQLNPDIRGVFDRMFATDQEIAEVQTYYDAQKPFFEDLEGAESEIYAKIRHEADLDAKDKRLKKYINAYLRSIGGEKAVREETKTAINAIPVYAAMDEAGKLGGINIGLIDDIIGEDARKRIPTRVKSKKGNINPDELALNHGFNSSEDMFSQMVEALPKGEAIEQGVINRLGEIQKDMINQLNDGIVADEDYHSESRMKVLIAEIKMLEERQRLESWREKATASRLKVQAIVAVAKTVLGSRTVRQAVSYSLFSRAEAKAAKKAREAYKKGDLEAAEKFKRQELLNHALVIESVKLKDEIHKGQRLVSKKLRSKSTTQDAKDLIQNIQARFGLFANISKPTYQKRRRSYLDWMNQKNAEDRPRKQIDFEAWAKTQEENGYDVYLDPDVINLTNMKFYKDISVDEFRGVIDAVKQIAHVEMRQRQIKIAGEWRKIEDVIDDLIRQMAQTFSRKARDYYDDDKTNLISALDARLMKMEFLFQDIDGRKIGIWHEYIFQRIAEAEERELSRGLEANNAIKDLLDKYFTQKQQKDMLSKRRGVYIPEIGTTLSRAQLIRTGLDFGNKSNFKRRMEGNGYNPEQMEAIKNHLTKNEWDFCQAVGDYINTFKQEAFDLDERILGSRPDEVLPNEFETKFGKYKGWYFPVTFNKKHAPKAKGREQATESLSFDAPNFAQAMTRRGYLKARAESAGGMPLSNDLTDIIRHVNGVIHDITHREAVVEIRKIFNHPKMQDALVEHLGPERADQFMPWLKDIANPEPVLSWGERVIRGVRIGVTVAKLGKLGVMFQQMAGFTQTIKVLGKDSWRLPKAYMQMLGNVGAVPIGLVKRVADKNATLFTDQVQWIMEESGFMRTRIFSYSREAYDVLKGAKGFKTIPRQVGELFMQGIGMFQLMTDIPTWTAAYEASFAKNQDHKKAVGFADSTVRTSQGGGGKKDLASVQRSNEALRLLTMFYSFMNLAYNHFSSSVRGKKVAFSDIASSIFFIGFIGPIAAEILSGRPPEDDEDWLRWAARLEARFYAGMFPFARDIASPLFEGFGYRISPVAQPLDTIAKGIHHSIKKEDPSYIVKPAFELGGMALKLPSDQMYRTGEAFYQWLVKDNKEVKPQDFIYGGDY